MWTSVTGGTTSDKDTIGKRVVFGRHTQSTRSPSLQSAVPVVTLENVYGGVMRNYRSLFMWIQAISSIQSTPLKRRRDI